MIRFLNLFKKSDYRGGNEKINILTRTSGRPNGFKKCHESIINQTYQNIDHIVSYDSEKDLDYLRKYNIKLVKVFESDINENMKTNNPNTGPFSPHNLYCNKLLEEVDEGWVMFLDDDDMLAHKNVLKKIYKKIRREDEDTLFIWQMRYPTGKLMPNTSLIKSEEIKLYNIGSPCFLFHSKYVSRAQWDAWKCADFRFIEQLEKMIPRKVFIEDVYVQLNNMGDLGKRNDI